jgi:hypothetical protein
MARSTSTMMPELEELNITEDTPCKGQHRDLRLWNRQKAECCLSCGAIYTLISDLHAPFKFGDEIRLLQLSPSNDDSDDLVGDLIHVRLGEDPRYEAVSYTWADESGDASPCSTLFIKSRDGLLKITRNCEAALRRFRSRYQMRLLWIDSICIDQQNSLERSEQVQMMTTIYQQAQRVLVFIGTPSEIDREGYSQLFQYIKSKQDHIHLLNRSLPIFHSWIVYDVLSDQNNHPQSLRDSLIKFLGHSWFNRIWIIQEIIMSRAATLHFGPFTVDWADLLLDRHAGMHRHSLNDSIVVMGSSVSGHIPPVLRLRKSIKFEGARLVDLLSATRTCKATDPRDKIFALLGMAKQEYRLELPQIDYTRSVEDVFAEATAYHVRSTGRLEILSSNLLSATNAASWVCDFSSASDMVKLPMEQDYIPVKRGLHKQNFVQDDSTLGVRYLNATGTQLDTITYMPYTKKRVQHACLRDISTSLWDFTYSLWHLFQTSSDLHMPKMLLHCPPPKGLDANSEVEPRTDTTPDHSPICNAAVNRLHERARAYELGRTVYFGEFTIGIVPKEARSGDLIWALTTMTNPLVLRRQEIGFQVIGPCMVIDPNNHSGCKSQYHRGKACNCTSCTSRTTYNYNTWGSKDIVLV